MEHRHAIRARIVGAVLVPQLLRLDFRFLTIVGELFVPVWCGVAAIVESARGRLAGAAAWLVVLAALVLAFDIQGFTLIGHTPVYWPLLPLFAAMTWRSRWVHAACLLGVLVVARTTLGAVVPVFLMAAWATDRRRFTRAGRARDHHRRRGRAVHRLGRPRDLGQHGALVSTRDEGSGVAGTRPQWDGDDRPHGVAHRTASRGLVVPGQLLVMTVVYGTTWFAIRRGAAPLPWMALALFAFSMTTLYPVHYLYYDVLLLLVSAAIVETLGTEPVTMAAKPWLASATVLIVLMVAAAQGLLPTSPHVAAGGDSPGQLLRAGFAMAESDGQRWFSWIVGHEATIVLPRRSAHAADIVLTAQSPFGGGDATSEDDGNPERNDAGERGARAGMARDSAAGATVDAGGSGSTSCSSCFLRRSRPVTSAQGMIRGRWRSASAAST